MSLLPDIFKNNVINLKNTFNLRTVGGFRTLDNRLVRKGILFRSDNLARLNTLDQHSLNILGIERIVDFRSKKEIEKEPDRIPKNMQYINMHINSDTKFSTELHLVLNGVLKKNMKEYLIEANRNFVLKNTPIFSKFIKDFIKSNGKKTLYHCTAGKDRTGFATAMVLSIIGVAKEIIIEEYLFSNYCIEKTINLQLAKVCKILNINEKDAFKILPVMKVDLEYINEAFQTIDDNYGNLENYIVSGLNISEQEREHLKNLLCV